MKRLFLIIVLILLSIGCKPISKSEPSPETREVVEEASEDASEEPVESVEESVEESDEESAEGVMVENSDQKDNYIKMPIFFATDRNYNQTLAIDKQLGGERGEKIRYGFCNVSIPFSHKVGEIERPRWWRLEFKEDPDKHVVIHKVAVLEENTFFSLLSNRVSISTKKKSFLFVHGYNTSFAEAAQRTAQISYDLSFDGAPVFYSWPSAAKTSAYIKDEANIEWAQTNIRNFLNDYIEKSGVEEIYLIAHSMGNRGLTRAIIDLIASKPELKSKIKEIILAAPDIDADVFKRDIAPQMVSEINKPITLYASSEDVALKASKEIHGSPRAGDTNQGVVLVRGIETVDASAISTSFLGHSYFADTPSIISDIFDLITKGERAGSRSGLEEVRAQNDIYWKVITPE
ncbi:alpha/beta hydrolase [Maribacter sp.]|nr:alpha/beta hydrolase [Maribacter sp.]